MAVGWRLLLASLLAVATAGPVVNRDNGLATTCATACPDTSKFSYETGKTYEYSYESDITTSIRGSSEEHSSLHVRATANVEVLAPCEMALTLTDVSLQDSNPAAYESRDHVEGMWDFKQALQERPLRFSFLDGRLDSVCAEPETDWVLNVKKGVLSGFQNTMERLDTALSTRETDVAGDCPVSYEVVGDSWGTTTVKKTKDLLGCTERMGHLTAFQSSPYKAPSAIQSLPVMKSSHECQQTVNSEGIITQSICTELHVFRPFSRHDNGAATAVTSKLSFVEARPGVTTRQGRIERREPLVFTHMLGPKQLEASRRQARQTLQQLCRSSQAEVTPDTPRLFTTLVRQLNSLDAASMTELFTEAKQLCDKAEKFVRDAIPMTSSAGSVTLIRQLIAAGDVSDAEADVWLTHLAFIANPTREMLMAIKPLLDLPQPYRKASLAVSTMIHSYCRKAGDACASDPEIRQIISLFEDKLRYNCKAEVESPDSHDEILMSLKALGNTGYAQGAIPALNRCFQNPEVSNEVRAAAINAFRRMGCEADHSQLTALFRNMQEDSELRINAYLALMQCPSELTIDSVIQMLNSEEVNQVGSFVWTHLTNLRESSDPHGQAVRDILESRRLQKTFDLDKRKFSRNMEASYFSDLLNAGAQLDANLIWSQHSFVPRAAMVNLTVDIFGESVNLLEVGGRVQGLERMLESLLRDEDTDRTTSELINSIDSKYNLQPDAPQGSYYLRVFGNEIRYDDLHSLDLATLKEKMNYLDWLIELSKEHNVQFTKSFMFLDMTTSVPTVAGLPICLTLDGTTVMNVDLTGKLDVRQMFTSPSTFDIDGTVKPSAAIELTSEMGVDAHVARTGVKMVSSVYTSTQATGKIQLKNAKVFNMEISAPQEQKEIIRAENKFFVTYRSQDREQRLLTAGRRDMTWCSGAPAARVTGLKLCARSSLPTARTQDSAWFPLTGPSSLVLSVENTDTFRTYNVDYRLTKERTQTEAGPSVTDTARLSINTPNSRVDRELTAELIKTDNSAVTFNLRTPWKKVALQASTTNTAELKKVQGTFSLDERSLLSLDAEVGVNQKAVRTDYTPKLELSVAGARPYILQGEVGYRAGKKAEVDMRLRNVLREPVRIQGSMEASVGNGRRKYDTDLQLTSGLLTGRFTGSTETVRRESMTISSALEYALPGQEQQRITFTDTVRNTLEGNLRSYGYDSTWTSTLWPEYNGNVAMDLTVDRTTVNGNLNAGFDETRKIVSNLAATYRFDDTTKNIDGTLGVRVPMKDLDYSARLGYLANANQLRTTASLRLSPEREGAFLLDLNRQSAAPMRASADLSLSYPGFSVSVSDKMEERANKEYHHDLLIQYQPYEDVRVNTVYKMLPRHEVDANVHVPGYQPLNIKGHLKPDLKHAQARGEVNYGGRQYHVETSWLHRGNPSTFNTRGDMTVSWPQRRITVEGTASRQGDVVTTSMETKWDAGVNDDKKVSIDGQVILTKSEPAMQMKVMVYPSHFVDIEASGKYETQGWYKTNSDVEARMQMRSSFPHWEDVSASFKHDRTKTEYLTEGEVMWAPRQKITGNFDIKKIRNWNKIETALKLSTPFEGFREIESDLSYNLAATRFSTASKLQLDGQVIDLEVNTELNRANHRFSADASFKSPFRYYEDLRAAAAYNDDGTRYRSSLEASWAPEKRVSAAFNMAHQTDANSLSNNGDLTINTPCEKYSSLKATWQHQKDASSLQSSGNLEVNEQRLGGYEIGATTRTTAQQWSVDLRAVLQQPERDDLTLIVDHRHNYKSYRNCKSDVSFRWASDKVVSIEHEMRRDADSLLFVKSSFASPFAGYEQLSLDSDTKNTEGHIVSEHQLQYGPQKKVNLNADMTVSGYTGQGRVQFTSPFCERVVVNFHNQREDGVWVSHVDAQYQNSKRIQLETQFGAGRRKVLGIQIRSPCPYLQDASFSATFTGSRRSFESTLEITHEKLASRISANVMANTADVNAMQATADILTPYDPVKFIKAQFNHRLEGNAIHTDAAVEVPTYKGTMANDVTIRNGRYLSTDTSVEYAAGKKIELNTEFKNARKQLATISLKAPFTHDILISVNHEGPWDSFTNEAEVRYSPREVMTSNVNFNLRGTTLTLSGTIQTPFENARRIVVGVNHEGAAANFKNDASVQVNDLTVSGNTEFSLSGYTMHVLGEARATSPLNGFTTLSVDINHNGPASNFNNDAKFALGAREVTASSEFRLQGNSVNGNAAIHLPLTQVRDISVAITHDGPASAFSNRAQVTYDDNQFVGTSEFNLRGNTMTAKASLQTPFKRAENMLIELGHNGPASAFTCSALLQLNKKKVTATHNFRLRGNELSAKMDIKLPIRELRTLGLEVNHNGPSTGFNNNAKLTVGADEISANSEFSLRGTRVNAKATINTPYEEYRTVSAEVNHEGHATAFKNDATFTYGRKQLTGNTEFNLEGNALATKAAISIPYAQPLTLSIELNHDGVWNDFNNNAIVIYGAQQVSGNSRLTLRPAAANGLVRIELPGEVNHLALEFNHQGPLNKFGNSAVLTIGERTINANSEFSLEGNNLDATFGIRTPYASVRRASAVLKHEGPVRNFKNSAEFAMNGRTISGNTEFRHEGTTITTKGGLSLPMEGYERLSFEADHNGPLDHFRNSATLSSGNRRMMATSEFHASGDSFMAKGEANVPFGPRTMSFEVNHEGRPRAFTNNAVVNYGRKQVRGSSEFNLEGNNLRGKTSLELPLETPFSASLEVTHQGPIDNFSNSVTAIHGTTEIRGNSNFQLQGNSLDMGASVNGLPIKGLKKLGIELHHSGHAKQFTNNGVLTYGKTELTGNTEFSIGDRTIRGKAELNTPYSDYNTMSVEFNHEDAAEGSCTTNAAVVCGNQEITYHSEMNLKQNPVSVLMRLNTPYDSARQLEFRMDHDGRNWRNFNNNGMLKWNSEKYTGKSEFRWFGKQFRLKGELNLPQEYSLKLNHKGGMTDFSNNLKIKWAEDVISGTSAFKLAGKTLEGNANVETSFKKARNMEITVNHDGGYNDFRSAVSVVTPFRRYKNWASTVTYKGQPNDFELGLDLVTPFDKMKAVQSKITHKGSLSNFRCTYNVNADGSAYNGDASFKKTARKIEASMNAETPFAGFERQSASFSHTGAAGRCETAVNVETSYPGYKRFVGEFSLQGTPQDFRTSAKVETPFNKLPSLTVTYNHQGDLSKFNCDGSVEYAGQTSTGTIAFELLANGVTANINVRTPYSGYERFTASLEHSSQGTDFHTVMSLVTPFPGYDRFASDFTHSGQANNFRTTATVETPFRALPSLTVNANHEYSDRQLSSGMSAEYSGKRLSAEVSHATTTRGFDSRLNVETPYPGHENYAVNIGHGGDLSNFKTTADVTTSVRNYRSFGLSLEHNGDLSNFQSTAAVTTPFSGYERFGLNVNHNCNERTFKTGAAVTTSIPGYENFGIEIEKTGAPRDFTASLTITTPFQHYQTMKAELTHECSRNKFMNNLALTTSYPGYERMGLRMTYEGTLEQFTTQLIATSSVPGYERFSATVEKSGSLNDLQGAIKVETPYRRYRKMDLTFNHNGNLRDFTTNVQAETSIPRYERLSGQLRHSGRLDNFESSAMAESSVPGYEKFAFDMTHQGSPNNFRTNGKVETPFRGHETYTYNVNHNYGSNIRSSAEVSGPRRRFAANVNHEMTGDGFNSDLSVVTPFPGYERFGLVVNHQGQDNGFRHTGTINLPFRDLPQIKYTVAHSGHLYDFTSSASVEYNNKKIEVVDSFKRTSAYAETVYEGSLEIKTPYTPIRNFRMTGSHNRKTDVKSGALDVVHNGEQKLDFDYSYTSSSPVEVTINVRNPSPMETRISVSKQQGGAWTGEAYLNWDLRRADSSVRGQVNVDLQPARHVLSVTATLPDGRTVGVSSNYAKTDDSLSHAASVHWASDDSSKLGYELELTKTMRRNQCLVDGSLKIQSPYGSPHFSYSCKYVAGRRCTVEVAVQTDRRIALTSDLTLNAPSFTHVLTLSHPDLRRDAVVTTEGTWDPENAVYDGRVEAQWGRETASFSGRVAREAPGRYMASARLAHPNSDLDAQFSGQLEDTAETLLASMETKWKMSVDREFRTHSLRAEINKLRKELDMNIVTPLTEVHVAGRQLSAAQGVYRHSAEATVGRAVYRAETELNVPEKNSELKVYYSPENFLHAYARYENPRQVKAEVYRQHNGLRIREMLLQAAQQDDSHSLTGTSHIRPDIWDELKHAITSEDYSSEWARVKQTVREAVQQEVSLKRQALARSFRPVLRLYNWAVEEVKAALVEAKQWASDAWTQIKDKVHELYDQNAYHLKDICQWAQRMTTKTRENYTVVRTQLYDTASATAASGSDIWRSITRAARDFQERARTHISDLSEQYQNFDIEPHLENARSTIEDYTERVRSHESVQRALGYLGTLREQWSSSDRAVAVVATDASGWASYARELVDQLSRREDVRAAKDYISGQLRNSQYVSDFSHYKEVMRGALDDYRTGGLHQLKTSAMSWAENHLQLDRTRFSKWLPEQGDYEFQMHVPLPLDDLQTMPKVTIRLGEYIRSLYELYQAYVPEYEWRFSDLYYRYKPSSSNIRDWVPPFDSYAALAGNQHYMTFDKRFYEFAGDCSYLLARDFIDGSFAVVVNYERSAGGRVVKKSLTAYLDDKTMEILPDGSLIVNGARLEMPVTVAHASLARHGNRLTLSSTHGVGVTCDLAHDVCTVEVSGWYFAKTAGLLGTYNNEPVDDLTASDRRQLASPAEFAASWATTSRCRAVNSAVDVSREATEGTRRYQVCHKFFGARTSPYRRCFDAVHPEPFMTMCVNDLPPDTNRMERDEDTCRVAAFYREQCGRKGVPITLDNVCVRCQKPNGESFVTGENVTLSGDAVPEAADVVFVIHQASCNQDIVGQLKDLVDDMEKVFAEEGMVATRYALIGYGGQGQHAEPHPHTMEGQVFNTRDKVLLGLENFATEAGEKADAFDAIRYAAGLPFAAGVSKTVVLLPCSSCNQGPVSFSEVQQLLLLRDIRFHVLLQHNFQLRGSSPKTAFIFGATRDTAFTRKHAGTSDVEGDPGLRQVLRMPKDLCVALTEEADGSVFNTLQWINNRPFVQKRYRDVLARVVADKAEPTDCQVCDCLPDNVGAGKIVCRSCQQPEPIYDMLPDFKDFDPQVPAAEETPETTPEVPQRPRNNNNQQQQQQQQQVVDPRKRAKQLKQLKARRQREARRLRMLNRRKQRQQS